MEAKCAINSIYRATEGEGILIGTPQIFVRFQGCSVGCLNCDSKDTWDFIEPNYSVSNLMAEIYELAGSFPRQIKRVSITGGDPLHPKLLPGTIALAKTLKKEGFFVSLEAAGTRVVDELFDVVDFVNFDLKTPSTGVRTNIELISKLNEQYENKFQVKAVIANEKDFDYALGAFDRVASTAKTYPQNWVLTPCYEPGENFPQGRFQEIINWNEQAGGPFRVIGQQHKWIHGPNSTNV
jgi:7-carboxy-7-deazaguanine synthase